MHIIRKKKTVFASLNKYSFSVNALMHHRSQTHLGTWFTDGKEASFYDLSPLLVPLGPFLLSTPRINLFYTMYDV